MLEALHIENIAVIERAALEPGRGLNVLTGETGAGKSIVIDSLQAILGGRVSRELVRRGADFGSVTAVFSGVSADIWLEENGIEAEESLIIRRRITADGKSSAYVNGVPVSAAQLRTLGALLLDIHGQNDGRQLMDEARHRDYLDGFAGIGAELDEYRKCYDSYLETASALKRLDMDEGEKLRRADALRYKVQELQAAQLSEGEEERLSSRRDLLRNAGKLTEAADGAYYALYGDDGSATERMGEARALLERVSGMSDELREAASELETALAAAEDAAERVRDFRESLDFSPEEYDGLESRLALLRRLQKKYAADEAGLIAQLEDAEAELNELEFSDIRRAELEKELANKKAAAYNTAKSLSERRKRAAAELQRRMKEGLRELSMPSVAFEVEILPLSGEPGFDAHGCDEVRFLMSANAGEKPGRIARIASGGELSRIMLVMKEVLSGNDGVQSMVFDEIDTGVSGVAAQRVGEKLARLSRQKQVICVTHLPQIAAMADVHFKIEKSEREGRTYTSVSPLTRQGRLMELARLHGGENITETTLCSAGEQLDAAQKYKEGDK